MSGDRNSNSNSDDDENVFWKGQTTAFSSSEIVVRVEQEADDGFDSNGENNKQLSLNY